jgi:DNA modification methylase
MPDPLTDIPSVKLCAHRLACADCTDVAAVARLMAGELADCMVTDPPYGVSYRGSRVRRARIANDTFTGERLRRFLAAAFVAAPLRPGGSFYVFAPGGPQHLQFRLALADAGLEVRQSLAWVKNHFVLGRADYHGRHENILYGWKPGPGRYFTPDRTQSTVWEFAKPQRSPLHPTTKPVPLLVRAILNSTRPGETVFDGFGGSGSTLMACEETGRRCRMVEIDPSYCAAIRDRWDAMAGR